MSAGLAFKGKVERHVNDNQYYPTPDDGTVEALYKSGFGPPPSAPVWEPAVGGWGMADVIERMGNPVIGSDIVDYKVAGRVTERRDFLSYDALRASSIITNPPYNAKDNNIGDRFIEHALRLNPAYMALLLKADFFCPAKSLKVFNNTYGNSDNERHPAAALPLTWRPDFTGQGKPFLTVMWVVWDCRRTGPTIFMPLKRP